MANYTTSDIQLTYIAYFGRPAEPEGLAFWESVSDSTTLEEMHAFFADQKEYRDYYADYIDASGNITDAEGMLDAVYNNLFNRDAEQGGKDFWIPLLVDGTVTIDDVVTEVLAGAQNEDLVAKLAKLQAAEAFTETVVDLGLTYAGQEDADAAHDWLAEIYDGDTLNAALDPAVFENDVRDAVEGGSVPPPVIDADPLTSGDDVRNITDGDVVTGDENTLNPGDKIYGDGGGTVDLQFSDGFLMTNSATIDGVGDITISSHGGLEINTSKWTNIGPDTITIYNTTGDVLLDDLQATSNDASAGSSPTTYAMDDVYGAADTVTLNFDLQAADASNTTVDLTVKEVHSAVAMTTGNDNSEAIEIVDLHIADEAGYETVMADLSVVGIETLNIDGGEAGLDFEITGALDAGLETINAATAESNLKLNVSESAYGLAMNVVLGLGDDELIVGDTIGDNNEVDTFDGGAGADTLFATFTSAGTRKPVINNIETLDLTFNDSATLDFSDVDDVALINIQPSTDRVQLIDMDNTVQDIHVFGAQTGRWDIDYEKGENADLTFTWTNDKPYDTEVIDYITFDEVQTLKVVSDGGEDVRFTELDVDNEVTEDLTFQVDGYGNMVVNDTWGVFNAESLWTSSAVVDLAFVTTSNGNLSVSWDSINVEDGTENPFGGPGPFQFGILDMDALENLTISASERGTILVGNIIAASQLETVNVTTAGADVAVASLIAYDLATKSDDFDFDDVFDLIGGPNIIDFDPAGATISEFNITSNNDQNGVYFGFIAAEEISDMNVVLNEDGVVNLNAVAPMFLETSGDILTVSGDGTFADLSFFWQTFEMMDFRGLDDDDADVWYANASNDVTYLGTAFNDRVVTGSGDQDIHTYEGTDRVIVDLFDNSTFMTQNYINTGADNDLVVLANTAASDLVNLGGTAVQTINPGGASDPGFAFIDEVRNFNGTNDQIEWGEDGSAVNYREADGAADTTFALALTHADQLLGNGGRTYAFLWNVGGQSNDGLLFKDTDHDGHAELVIQLTGAADATFLDWGDIDA